MAKFILQIPLPTLVFHKLKVKDLRLEDIFAIL